MRSGTIRNVRTPALSSSQSLSQCRIGYGNSTKITPLSSSTGLIDLNDEFTNVRNRVIDGNLGDGTFDPVLLSPFRKTILIERQEGLASARPRHWLRCAAIHVTQEDTIAMTGNELRRVYDHNGLAVNLVLPSGAQDTKSALGAPEKYLSVEKPVPLWRRKPVFKRPHKLLFVKWDLITE